MGKSYLPGSSNSALLAAGSWDWTQDTQRSGYWHTRMSIKPSNELINTVFPFLPALERDAQLMWAESLAESSKSKGAGRGVSVQSVSKSFRVVLGPLLLQVTYQLLWACGAM
jgi:hypothetical protein